MNMKRFLLLTVITFGLLGTLTHAQAQSWKDAFNKDNISKVVDAVNDITGESFDMVGTWNYSGAAVAFKSDDLLKKAGGAVAAATAEKKLNEQLAKVGFTEGSSSFTFNADSTFTSTVGKRTLKGTYSYDQSSSTVTLKYAKLIGLNAKLSGSSSKMELLFDADKLLTLITFIGGKSSSGAIKTIATLAEGYDGMMLGMELTK